MKSKEIVFVLFGKGCKLNEKGNANEKRFLSPLTECSLANFFLCQPFAFDYERIAWRWRTSVWLTHWPKNQRQVWYSIWKGGEGWKFNSVDWLVGRRRCPIPPFKNILSLKNVLTRIEKLRELNQITIKFKTKTNTFSKSHFGNEKKNVEATNRKFFVLSMRTISNQLLFLRWWKIVQKHCSESFSF